MCRNCQGFYFGGRTNLPAISLHDLGSTFQLQGPPALPQITVSGAGSDITTALRSAGGKLAGTF